MARPIPTERLSFNGPCGCDGTLVMGDYVGAPRVKFPTDNAILTTNRSYTLRWDSQGKADKLQLDLRTYLDRCTNKSVASNDEKCGFETVYAKLDLPDTGEAQWTLDPGLKLEARDDYVLSGGFIFEANNTFIPLISSRFAIVNEEGQEPLHVPDRDALFSSLPSSTSSQATATISKAVSLTGIPTISGVGNPIPTESPSPSTNGNTAAAESPNWKIVAMLGFPVISWLCSVY